MIAVQALNLRKVYKLYESPPQRLKEIILRRPFHKEFVALQDISFSVSKGETFGIIGENGAGKSTLLKILAKTLKPTSGELSITGRSTALLELGAGFNPELTGEENIYLNAYLLGLSKREVDEKKREIIDFSELGDSIGRPVKTYSSGMHVRLAFSVAISVNPDILIIDEALSVGDQHFQKKCIDRMMDFRKSGKTIVFCSHSLYHIQELCNKAAWMLNGTLQMYDLTERVVNEYQNYLREKDRKDEPAIEHSAESPITIKEVSILNKEGNPVDRINSFQPLYLKIKIRSSVPPLKGHIGFALGRNDGETCFATTTHFDKHESLTLTNDLEIRIVFPSFPLLNGIYFFRVTVADETALIQFDTASSTFFSVFNSRKELGMFFLEHTWELEKH